MGDRSWVPKTAIGKPKFLHTIFSNIGHDTLLGHTLIYCVEMRRLEQTTSKFIKCNEGKYHKACFDITCVYKLVRRHFKKLMEME